MNKLVPFEAVWIFLRQFFNYRHYEEGVADAKEKIRQDPLYSRRWSQISNDILNRAFLPGEPLILVRDGANQVLDENSDEEAYKWLDLMVSNIERKDGKFVPY
ncbi:MAG: hypothetical protein IPJ90_23345 [Anaerolineaceae bacterium]|nr:hypothetical protein [Anaerolineaceae bacterium]